MIKPDELFGRMGNRLFHMAYIYAQYKNGLVDDMYLQDEKYFAESSEDIKKWYGQDIFFLPYVSIHIRRGDYVDNSFYTNLDDTDYYERAIELFPFDKFVVFSDDIEFAKTKFKGDRFSFYEGKDEIDDFNTMASCKDNIIANSSFSWWAAYLNPNPGKKVVAPKDWYTDGVERTKAPDGWLRI